MVFDFVEGGVGAEQAPARNRAALDGVALQPRVLQPAAPRRLGKRFLGRDYGLPFGVAPMGMCALAWPGADRMLARAATDFQVPLCLSSAASCTIEEMHAWAGELAWFQLYLGPSQEHGLSLVERAKAAGYQHLLLTVDVPQVSRRARDLRNGFRVPFRVGPRQALDLARHPHWSLATLAAGVPQTRNFADDGGPGRFDRNASRAGADWDFLARLRDLWPGTLIVKGVLAAADATRIRDCGADAIYVSNHGGRQLDSAPGALGALPGIRAAVGPDYPLLFDSGLRGGEDVVKALALGADFAMVGRPWLFALGAEGERGLQSLFRIFAEELALTLAQLGLAAVEDIDGTVLFAPADREGTAREEPVRLNARRKHA